MSLAWGLVSLFVLIAGCGWLWIARVKVESASEALGWSLLGGFAWLAIGYALLAWLGPIATPTVMLAWMASPLVLALALRRRPENFEGWTRHAASFLPAVLLFGLALWMATARPVWNIDAQTRWVLHGQWIAEYAEALPEAVDGYDWTPTHPRYPPLVPGAVGLAIGLGADPALGVRALFPWFFLALLAVFHGQALRSGWRPLSAAIVVAALGLTPALSWLPRFGDTLGLGADAAMADLPLASYVLASALACLHLLRGESEFGWLAALALAGATLTKQEGTAIGLWLLASTAFLAWKRQRLSALALPAAAFVLLTASWKLASASMPVAPGEDYLSFGTLTRFFGQLDRLGEVLPRMLSEFANFPVWGPLWLLPLLSLVAWIWVARKPDRAPFDVGRETPLTLLWLAGALALVIFAYVVTGWKNDNYALLMEFSMSRLVMHSAPLAALSVLPLRAAET